LSAHSKQSLLLSEHLLQLFIQFKEVKSIYFKKKIYIIFSYKIFKLLPKVFESMKEMNFPIKFELSKKSTFDPKFNTSKFSDIYGEFENELLFKIVKA
jgi:hypothetical protein